LTIMDGVCSPDCGQTWDSRGFGEALDDLGPALTPQRLLEDLFAAADVPLLDEAAELLGQDERVARALSAREQAQRVAYAQGVLDIAAGSRDPSDEVLSVADLLDKRMVSPLRACTDRPPVCAELAARR